MHPTPPIPPPDLVALGHEVARLRRERGWSLDKLADASGVSRKTLINLENAHKEPRVGTLHAVAHALGAPLATLVSKL